MTEIKWEDPPDKAARKGKWASVFDQLNANPNKWARLYEGKDRNAHSLAGRLRKSYGSDYEIRSRKTGDGTAGVWARYVPASDPVLREHLWDADRLQDEAGTA